MVDWTKWTAEGLKKHLRGLEKEYSEHKQMGIDLKFIMHYHERKARDIERVMGQIRREQARRAI